MVLLPGFMQRLVQSSFPAIGTIVPENSDLGPEKHFSRPKIPRRNGHFA
jgi:hypothetical protein